eukprot:Ihof_evm6s61 gene=Ihof_evmTU6s61
MAGRSIRLCLSARQKTIPGNKIGASVGIFDRIGGNTKYSVYGSTRRATRIAIAVSKYSSNWNLTDNSQPQVTFTDNPITTDERKKYQLDRILGDMRDFMGGTKPLTAKDVDRLLAEHEDRHREAPAQAEGNTMMSENDVTELTPLGQDGKEEERPGNNKEANQDYDELDDSKVPTSELHTDIRRMLFAARHIPSSRLVSDGGSGEGDKGVNGYIKAGRMGRRWNIKTQSTRRSLLDSGRRNNTVDVMRKPESVFGSAYSRGLDTQPSGKGGKLPNMAKDIDQ